MAQPLAGRRSLTLAQRRILADGSEMDQAPLLVCHLQHKGAVITDDAVPGLASISSNYLASLPKNPSLAN